MAAQTSTADAVAADDMWSKLPSDLLGEVYGKIASPLYRIRFAAVCRSWRAVTLCQPQQPAIPWLFLPRYSAERVFCPVDGAILRTPFPIETIGKTLVGCYDGGWIAATSDTSDGTSLVIVNLFSGAKVPLSAMQRATPKILKVAFSEAPTSKHCILAAATQGRYGLALCRIGCRNHSWRISDMSPNYDDIVFCHGKLYGLDGRSVFVHHIRMTKDGSPVVSTTCELRTDQQPRGPAYSITYIVGYKDTLLMVLRAMLFESREFIFKVFELVSTENACYNYTWAEVMTLDDHALFLSTKCSRAVRVPASGRRGGVERNHIYYNHNSLASRQHEPILDNVQLTWDSVDNLYCMKNKKGRGVDMIMSTGYYVTSCYQDLTWLLPPDF